MQYTTHYNLNLPEGTDIVNPLVQDNPNYTAIDTALYNNKLRVIGSASEVKSGTVHAITRSDTDINVFRFVATSNYATGDTFTVDGVSVTAVLPDGTNPKNGAFVINASVLCILDGTRLALVGLEGEVEASTVSYDNTNSGLNATEVQSAIDEINDKLNAGSVSVTADGTKTWATLLTELYNACNYSNISVKSYIEIRDSSYKSYIPMCRYSGSFAQFRGFTVDTNTITSSYMVLGASGAYSTINSSGRTDLSSNVPSNGTIILLHY